MKHKNSITQAYRARNEMVIPMLFGKAKKLAVYPTTTKHLFEIAADLPVNQFYISDDAALEYIRNRYYRGIVKRFRSPYKARLFEAFYKTFCEMIADKRYSSKGVTTVTILALSRPAPCVGITPRKMHQRYLEFKKRQHEKKVK